MADVSPKVAAVIVNFNGGNVVIETTESLEEPKP